jgi:hypothetical protein
MGAGADRALPSLSESDIVTRRLHRRAFLSTFGIGTAIALTAAVVTGCGHGHDGTCRTTHVDADPRDPVATLCDQD